MIVEAANASHVELFRGLVESKFKRGAVGMWCDIFIPHMSSILDPGVDYDWKWARGLLRELWHVVQESSEEDDTIMFDILNVLADTALDCDDPNDRSRATLHMAAIVGDDDSLQLLDVIDAKSNADAPRPQSRNGGYSMAEDRYSHQSSEEDYEDYAEDKSEEEDPHAEEHEQTSEDHSQNSSMMIDGTPEDIRRMTESVGGDLPDFVNRVVEDMRRERSEEESNEGSE